MSDPTDNELAQAMMEELRKFNPLKPWAEMNDEDKGKFIVLSQWFLFRLRHAPDHLNTSEALHWPMMLIMLRCHGRILRNIVVEYESDPEQFLVETERMRVRYEANLHAYAKEAGIDDPEDLTSGGEVRELRRMIPTLIRVIKQKIAEEGDNATL